MSNPPPECEKYVNETVVVTYVKEYWLLLFIVIVIGFVIFSGLVKILFYSVHFIQKIYEKKNEFRYEK